MTHTNDNNIFRKAGQKTIALFVACALLISGAVTAVVNFFTKDDEIDNTTSKAVETQLENPLLKLLILTEPFDINDAKAVNARAKAIWEISEKKYSELDYANMIYILASKKDSIKYPESVKTDAEKFEYLQKLALLLGSTLDDDLSDYVNASSNGVPLMAELKAVPAAYMFMAGKTVQDGETKKLVATEGQKQAIELRKIIFKHKDNIIKNDKEALKSTAEKFYSFYKSIETMEISDSEKFALYKDVEATRVLFGNYLTNEQVEDLGNVVGIIASYQNKLFQDAAVGLNISEIINKGNYGKKQPTIGESYNSTDAPVANAIIQKENEKLNKESTTKLVDEGGKPLTTMSEVINPKPNSSNKETTTNKVTTTFKVDVTEGKIVVPIPKPPTTSSSGNNKGNNKGNNSSTTAEETIVVNVTGKGKYEVIINPGGEPVGEIDYYEENHIDGDAAEAEAALGAGLTFKAESKYTDADAPVKDGKLSTTYTLG